MPELRELRAAHTCRSLSNWQVDIGQRAPNEQSESEEKERQRRALSVERER
ncbi:DUF2934 domain-containing protein [Caenorhabditis elegans]|uniref:DUF2934 domain-containing protein n=1 Tax=Caenorhabditis elegans TaxID=6239 RepID=Q27GU5_CAEEL|nr:DUF2934 domain-containing protein [Caenorhabditis elegans]CCD66041.2 DUF2934 domain-containing protein [Caenorhabditis elegans]